MPTLTVTKTYANEQVLTENDLDNIKDSIETFVNITLLGADNIQDGAIGTAELSSASVTSAKLANASVTDVKLASSSSDDSARAVATNSIKDQAVTTAKIADANVTLAKLAALVAQSLVPAGTIHAWGGRLEDVAAPTGFLYCDGSAVSRASYASLFAVIGTNFGYGDQSTTFNVPDLRGMFLRGINDAGGQGQDPSAERRAWLTGSTTASVGSYEPSAYRDHTHGIPALTPNSNLVGTNGGLGGVVTSASLPNQVAIGDASSGSTIHQLVLPSNTTFATGGNPVNSESRPINIGVNYIIKI